MYNTRHKVSKSSEYLYHLAAYNRNMTTLITLWMFFFWGSEIIIDDFYKVYPLEKTREEHKHHLKLPKEIRCRIHTTLLDGADRTCNFWRQFEKKISGFIFLLNFPFIRVPSFLFVSKISLINISREKLPQSHEANNDFL